MSGQSRFQCSSNSNFHWYPLFSPNKILFVLLESLLTYFITSPKYWFLVVDHPFFAKTPAWRPIRDTDPNDEGTIEIQRLHQALGCGIVHIGTHDILRRGLTTKFTTMPKSLKPVFLNAKLMFSILEILNSSKLYIFPSVAIGWKPMIFTNWNTPKQSYLIDWCCIQHLSNCRYSLEI